MHPAPRALAEESADFEGRGADHERHAGRELDDVLHDDPDMKREHFRFSGRSERAARVLAGLL